MIKDRDKKRFSDLVKGDWFKGLFQKENDLQHYTERLIADLGKIGIEEVDLVDFIGIEVIRVFAPEVCVAMANAPSLFTRTFSEGQRLDQTRKDLIRQILDKAPNEIKKDIKEIICQLFPQVNELETGKLEPRDVHDSVAYALRSERDWGKARRVCSKDMFDKYFSLSVPEGTLSVREMKDFVSVSATDDIRTLMEKLDKFEQQGKIRTVSRRLYDYLDELNDLQRKNLLVSTFNFAEKVNDRKQGTFDFEDFATQVEWFAIDILRGIEKEKRLEFVGYLIRKTAGFFVMNQLLNSLVRMVLVHKQLGGEEPVLIKNEVDKLRNDYVEKIKLAAKEGTLLGGREWGFTLRIWGLWGLKEESGNYTEGLIKTDEGVLKLLRELNRMWETPADRTSREMAEEFIELEELDKRISAIDVRKLNKEDYDIIYRYKNSPTGPIK